MSLAELAMSLAESAVSLAALARLSHLQVLTLQEKSCLQGRQAYSSSASPLQAPRDFPDVVYVPKINKMYIIT